MEVSYILINILQAFYAFYSFISIFVSNKITFKYSIELAHLFYTQNLNTLEFRLNMYFIHKTSYVCM